jgi:hypothetical protein
MKTLLPLFILITLFFGGCSFKNDLKIEAKIIYNMGGPQPVARQKFYLVSVDPMAIRGDDPKLKAKLDKLEGDAKNALLFQSMLLPLLKAGIEEKTIKEGKEKIFLNSFESSKDVWSDYLVAETTTDFDGKAVFKDVPNGEYWLVGQTETRAAFTLWDLKIKTPINEEKLLLDQNNALYSK